MLHAKAIIDRFNLKPLQREGGFYTQTYCSSETISKEALPSRYKSDKPFGTAIYYLLTPETFSSIHRLPTDEIYHFYLGDPIIMLQPYSNGESKIVTIGNRIEQGQQLQVIVPKGVWQGSYLKENGRFALVGTTMAPGFDFSDYEPGDPDILIRQYPERRDLIKKLTLHE